MVVKRFLNAGMSMEEVSVKMDASVEDLTKLLVCWIRKTTYTHISHTISGKKDNATPLFDWGKYYEKDGKVLIPISAQAHHSFVDGLHIGQFVEKLQKMLNEWWSGVRRCNNEKDHNFF